MSTTKAKYDAGQKQPQPLDLAAIEARLLAATPGAWRWEQSMNFPEQWPGNASGTFTFKIITEGDNPVLYLPMRYALIDKSQTKANADLIAHAPADLRALLAEVERLRLALEKEQHARRDAEQDAQYWKEEAEALRLQVAQLAEALEVATQ